MGVLKECRGVLSVTSPFIITIILSPVSISSDRIPLNDGIIMSQLNAKISDLNKLKKY